MELLCAIIFEVFVIILFGVYIFCTAKKQKNGCHWELIRNFYYLGCSKERYSGDSPQNKICPFCGKQIYSEMIDVAGIKTFVTIIMLGALFIIWMLLIQIIW